MRDIKALIARNSTIDASGCWLWRKVYRADGYVQIQVEGCMKYVHRIAYEAFLGPIPSGLQLDHLCRRRHCVNPSHLEPVTPAGNSRRGVYARIPDRSTTCKRGHPFIGANLIVRRNGWRRCRECARIHHLGAAQKARGQS